MGGGAKGLEIIHYLLLGEAGIREIWRDFQETSGNTKPFQSSLKRCGKQVGMEIHCCVDIRPITTITG